MAQIGAVPLDLKTELGWMGQTTKSRSTPGKFELLENCYVSSDAGEIRMFPGWVCVIDPVSAARQSNGLNALSGAVRGYERDTVTATRPSYVASTAATYNIAPTAVSTDVQKVWSRPVTMHFVEQFHGQWVFCGESGDTYEPILDAATGLSYVKITSYDDLGGTEVNLTLSAAPKTTANTFNSLQPFLAASGDRIWIDGLTGDPAVIALLNGRSHKVVNIVGSVVTITTNVGVLAAPVTSDGYIARIRRNTGTAANDLTDVSDDAESLTTWTTPVNSANINIDPGDEVFPAFVANRQRDFGDAVGNIREGNAHTGAITSVGRSRRRQEKLPYRFVPHIARDKIIVVAPGHGCIFQIPKSVQIDYDQSGVAVRGVQWVGNDIYDMPRCLGVPKAVLWYPRYDAAGVGDFIYSAASLPLAWGGTDPTAAARAGAYLFKLAYKDEVTGEYGLVSAPISVVTSAVGALSFQGIRIAVYFPGYLMPECLALTINVYRTKKNGTTYYFDRTITMGALLNSGTPGTQSAKYGLTPNTAAADEYFHHVLYQAVYRDDADFDNLTGGEVPETVQQMPMGAKAGRTIRGWSIFGGALGDSGVFKEMRYVKMSLEYDRNANTFDALSYSPDQINSRYTATAVAGFERFDSTIYGSYAGQTLFSRYLFPYPRQSVVLNKVQNTEVGVKLSAYPGDLYYRIADLRFSILDTPVKTESDVTGADFLSRDCYLLMPRGQLQISEADNPGYTPATNTTVISNELGEDIEGIGDAGGQAVVCTRNRTYILGFSQSPVGVPAEIASDRFGCIAANSMVQFDGGCAWISDRGPVAFMGGAVRWIGEDLEHDFVGETYRYLKDSDGMMRHSWACHDAERGLIYFGMFRDRFLGTADEVKVSYNGTKYSWTTASGSSDGNKIKSRFPCDEILVYSYKVNAWSRWLPPSCIAVQWMTSGIDADQKSRVFFLGNDNRLYAFDDTYGEFDRESNLTTVLQTGSVTTITGLNPGIRIRKGLRAVFYTGGGTTKLTLLGERTVASVGATDITLSSAITIPTGGCTMIVGARKATIRSTFRNVKRTENAVTSKLGLRYSLQSRYGTSGGLNGNAQVAFAGASMTSASLRDSVMTKKQTSFSTETSSAVTYTNLAQDSSTPVVMEAGLDLGIMDGFNHQAEIQLLGGAQVRLIDAYLEVK